MLPQLKIWTRICLMCVCKSLTLILTMLHILFPFSSLLWLFSLDSLPFSFNNNKKNIQNFVRQQTRDRSRKQQIEYILRTNCIQFFCTNTPQIDVVSVVQLLLPKEYLYFCLLIIYNIQSIQSHDALYDRQKIRNDIDKHLAEIIIQYFHCFLLLYVQFSRQTIAAFV